MKSIRFPVLLAVLLATSTPLLAELTKTWQFLQPGDYEYDRVLISVHTNPPGMAALLLQADEQAHATVEDYTAPDTSRLNVQMGFPTSIAVTRDPLSHELYAKGIFRSRVIRTKGHSDYVVARVSNADHTGDPALLALLRMNDDGWRDAASGQLGLPEGDVGFSTDAREGSHSGQFNRGSVALPGNLLTGATAFSVALWAKLAPHVEDYAGLAGYYAGEQDLFYIDEGEVPGAIRTVLRSNGAQSSISSIPVPNNTWTFLVITWDAKDAGRLRVYLNGQFYGSAANATTNLLNQSVPIYLGWNPSVPDAAYMNGFLDGVAIWNRSLSFLEIADLYDSYRPALPYRFQFRSAATADALANKAFVGPRGTTNDYYYGARFRLQSAGSFDASETNVQYRAELMASRSRAQAPTLEALGIYSEGAGEIDRTHLDFLGTGSQFVLDTTNTPIQSDASWSYLGLARQNNGGYYTNGVYSSRVFGSSDRAVTWDRISWKEGAKEISRTGSTGLIGLYHCRSSWADDSGSGHSGSATPSVSYTDLGKLGGRSAIFNGVNASVTYFDYGDSPVRSMEFWINDSSVDDGLIQMNTNSAIMIRDRMIVTTGFTGAKPAIYVNSRPVAGPLLQGWNHVALVWPSSVSASILTVGRTDGANPDYMEGKLDELALYDRELQRSEIVDHYTVGRREVAGAVRFQVRSSDDPTFHGIPFVGPLGTEDSYFSVWGAIPTPPGHYCQYAAYLDGEGDATPALTSVTIDYDLLSKSVTDATVADFDKGTFVGGTVRPYGQKLDLVDQGFLGPANMSRFSYPSLVGLWHLDEEAWGNVIDELGDGDGSATGGAKTSDEALSGVRCGAFDGIDDRVLLGNSPFAVSTFSVSLWFQSTTELQKALISSYIAGGAHFWVELNSDGFTHAPGGRLAFVIDDAFFGPVAVDSRRTGLNDGVWHNVIGMRNGRQLLLYVDGSLEGTVTLHQFYGDANGGHASLAYDSRWGYFQGSIDEVALFTSALTLKQVSQLCGAGVRTLETGEFVGPTVAAPDTTIWDEVDWAVQSAVGTPLTTNDDSLAALWHMDETTGASTVADAAGGHDGTLVGVSGAPGKFGNCVHISGVSARVTITDSAELEPQQLTVEAWVSPNDPSAMTVLDKRTGSTGYALAMDAQGRPYFWVGDGSAGVTAASPVGIRVGAWSHVAGSYDGTTVRLYVNGRAQAEAPLAGGNADTMGGNLLLGVNYQNGERLVGKLDEVAIHSRALTPIELEEHYAAGAVSIKFQARTWDPGPIGQYVGPGMSNTTYFTQWYGSLLKGSVPLGRYLQYKALLSTEDYRFPPALYGIHVSYSSYPLGNPTINPTVAAGYPFLANLMSFSDSKSTNAGTDVRYQITADEGTTNRWFYWDSSTPPGRWADATGLSPAYAYSSSASTINQYIGRFYPQWYNGVGGRFRFKAFLHSTGDQPTELSSVTLTASEGRIVITAPNGQERGNDAWLIGTLYDITWSHDGTVAGTVKIDYSLNGGTNWTQIASGVSATADRYPWITSGQRSDNALIRILHEQNATIYDYSDGPFELTKRYHVIVPNGGEKWYIGETNNIVWGASDGLGDVSIDYSGNGVWTSPVKIGDFIRSVPGVTTNRHPWAIQTDEPRLPSTNGRIRLQTFGGQATDYSDAPFTIAGASFTFPFSGSSVIRGTQQNITWNSAACGAGMILRVQTKANGPWVVVAGAVPNVDGTNSFAWTATNPPTGTARIRLTSATDPRAKGISDAFTIAGIVILSPNGHFDPMKSERWLMGSTQTVSWISAGVSDRVNVRFSADEGSTWIPIDEDIPNSNAPGFTNTYRFTVPPIPTRHARLRIEDGERPNELWDVSDHNFQVAGVRITWPNGPLTQEWPYNQPGAVQWLQNAVGPYAIAEFSYDGGVSWENIRGFVGGQVSLGDGESPPYTPHTPTVRGLVRLTPTDPAPFTNVRDTSDSRFTVAGVKIEAPAAGAQYKIGNTKPIIWVAAGTHDADGALDIYYSGDGVNFDRTPAGAIRIGEIFSEDYPGRQTFNWTVARTREPSRVARIMIKAGNYESISPPFTVQGLSVKQPASTDHWHLGATQTIRWSAAAAGDTVGIFYSSDGGTTYDAVPVAQGTASSDGYSTYDWTVETWRMPSSLNARLKIVSSSGITTESDPFVMEGIQILRPRSTDIYAVTDATNRIDWVAVGDPGPYVLEYFREGVGPFPITTVSGTTEWNWTIPASAASTGVQVRVTGSVYANTSESFRVVNPPGIVIRSPLPGEFWRVGATQTVEWSRGGELSNNFRVEVSLKPYAVTQLVANGSVEYDPGANVFRIPWSVPDQLTQARFIVTHNTAPGVRDVSGEFNLVGAFEVRVPNGGDKAYALQPVPVTWRTVGSVPEVNVYYSVTPPYKASSWIKVNDTPITNNTKPDFEFEETSWPWTAANTRSSLAKIRVQEAQYTQLFDEGADGPFDDSDAPFKIGYYSVNWIVMDAGSSNRLDNLSAVDSSGWSASGLSCIPSQTIVREYPWGAWNTAWYRAGYGDEVVLNWTSENVTLGSPPVWTQRVYMTPSAGEPDYHVLANFAYRPAGPNFLVSSWLEHGGLPLDEPTAARVYVYDARGALLPRMPVVNTSPRANDIFWTTIDAGGMTIGSTYFARVDIDYLGEIYSTGFTFELSVAPIAGLEVMLTNAKMTPGGVVLDWQANAPNLMYAVESCTGSLDGVWFQVVPTSQWWTTKTSWTNTGPLKSTEFFRVRAKE